MYKITLYDECCSPICDGTVSFFVEDLKSFEENWYPRAHKDQWDRYQQSKVGKIVTDYYGNNPKFNIVQEDKEATIWLDQELEFLEREYKVFNTYNWDTDIFAAKTTIVFRGIKFKGINYLIGKYAMKGVCQKTLIYDCEEGYEAIHTLGNPVIICSLHHRDKYDERGNIRAYKKEEFRDDCLETYCWITIKEITEKELSCDTLDLSSESILSTLFRDIPGETG